MESTSERTMNELQSLGAEPSVSRSGKTITTKRKMKISNPIFKLDSFLIVVDFEGYSIASNHRFDR